MKKYNFRFLIEDISKQHNIPASDVRKVFEGLIERIHSLKEPGDVLYIKSVGSFKVAIREPKKTNLNNKEEIIPKRKVIIFKRSSKMKEIK